MFFLIKYLSRGSLFQDRDQIQIRANFIIEDKVLVKISINDLL